MDVITRGSNPPIYVGSAYYGPTPGYLDYLEKYATDDERFAALDAIHSITGFTPHLTLSHYRKELSRLNLSKHRIDYYDTPSFIRRHLPKW